MKLHFLSCVSLMALFVAGNAYAVTVNVDFTTKTQAVNSKAFSLDISEYSAKPGSSDFAYLTALGLDAMRIDLQNGNGGTPQLGAGGTSGNGDPWVQAIENAGAMPIIRVHTGNENDNGSGSGGNAADAQAMVQHYTANYTSAGLASPVLYYVIGNESNANDQSGQYFKSYAPGMRSAAGRTIYIGGPAWFMYDEGVMMGYYNNTKGTAGGPDFLDYHQYASGPNDGSTLQNVLNGGDNIGDVQEYGSVSYEAEVNKLESDIGHAIPIEVGEWGEVNTGADGPSNWDPVWHASALGHIVKAGGISLVYADKNLINGGAPKAAYYSYLMFTGGQHKTTATKSAFAPLFQHFGTYFVQVNATGDTVKNIQGASVTTNNTVEVYASSNPTNIVVINKTGETVSVSFQLTGAASTADQWETTGGMPTKVKSNIAVNGGAFTANLSAYGVDTFVLPTGSNGGSGSGGTGTGGGTGGGTGSSTPTITVKDGQGNTWTVVNGKVYENGQLAGFTSQVTNLVNSGGIIYQENSAGLWWKWVNGSWAATAAPTNGSTSGSSGGGAGGGTGSGTSSTCTIGNSVTDGLGNNWTIVNGVVKENGQNAGFSTGVTQLVYEHSTNLVYQENSSKNWWAWENGSWTAVTAPDTSGCSSGNATAITVSSCEQGGTTVEDNKGNIWTIVNGVVKKNGQNAGFSIGVILLKCNSGGEVCQENSSKNWWCWSNDSWFASTAP